MNDISIVFICDDNYVMPTGVAINSLRINRCKQTFYKIYVLTNNVAEENEAKILMLNDENFSIEIKHLNKNETYVKNYMKNKKRAAHVSYTALYKFDICNIFESMDKILYLDSDIIIKSDLIELFNTDLGEKYAGVVKDYAPMKYNPPITEKLKINHTAYFSSGVMLLNLKKMRDDNLYEKLVEYSINGLNFFRDQDTFNVVFKENVIYLSFKYNANLSNLIKYDSEIISKYYDLVFYENKINYFKDAYIIHMTTLEKPWKKFAPYLTKLFKYYLNNSPFKQKFKVRFSKVLFMAFIGKRIKIMPVRLMLELIFRVRFIGIGETLLFRRRSGK